MSLWRWKFLPESFRNERHLFGVSEQRSWIFALPKCLFVHANCITMHHYGGLGHSCLRCEFAWYLSFLLLRNYFYKNTVLFKISALGRENDIRDLVLFSYFIVLKVFQNDFAGSFVKIKDRSSWSIHQFKRRVIYALIVNFTIGKFSFSL